MTEEIAVRIQRMKGAYAKFDRKVFQSSLGLKYKAGLFNTIVVVMNGLFGCQVWNVTQAQVGELETAHFSLLRKMLKKSTREWSRGAVMKYAAEKN